MLNWWIRWRDDCVRAKADGRVIQVQTGFVVIGDRRYEGLSKTHVQLGQRIKRGQVVGRK